MMWTLYLLTLAYIAHLGESLTVTSENQDMELDPDQVNNLSNGPFTLPCRIRWSDNMEPVSNPASWSKSQGGREFVDLTTSAQIQEPFLSTTRFSVTPVVDSVSNVWDIPLTIRSVSYEDDGVYRCGTTEVYVQYIIKILRDIDSLEITGGPNASDELTWNSNALIYHFPDNGHGYGYFQCMARGGSPPATLHVSLEGDSTQLTGHLQSGHNESWIGDTPGLQSKGSVSWIRSDQFYLAKEDHNKALKCKATINKGNDIFDEIIKTAIVTVNYKPIISCDPDGYQMPLTGTNINIQCTLTARPIPHHVSFHSLTTNDEIVANGGIHDSLNAQASMFVPNDKSDTVTVSLTFINVESTHYQTYSLRASNTVGNSEVDFQVSEGAVALVGESVGGGSTSVHVSASLVVLLVSSVYYVL